MPNFDDLKLSVEALSGGKNTVLFDDLGMPSIYVVIPKGKISDVITGGSAATHPAFIVNSAEKEQIHISKYQNIVMNNRAYSLPFKDPRANITFDNAKLYCENKGLGHHLMTNAEWAYIALWCKKNGFMPRGNNNYGKDISAPHEKGVVTYYSGETPCRVATGSGPASWAHDNTNAGIFDLNGNVYEWNGGLRLNEGEIQIIPNNDAAQSVDQGATSTLWKAILATDGSLVAPGTAGTLKFDYTIVPPASSTGSFELSNVINNKQVEEATYGQKTFETLTVKTGLTVPEIMKALAIYPIDSSHGEDNIFIRNIGERLCRRGGSCDLSAGAGVFCLFLIAGRSRSNPGLGFRSAFVNL